MRPMFSACMNLWGDVTAPLARARALRAKGILGMNRRNIAYISRYNPRYLFPLVDNKLLTKKLALEHRLQVPDLIDVIDSQHQVDAAVARLKQLSGFCIKPAKGSGGKGILVIARCEGGVFYRASGEVMSDIDVQRHISNILAGLFSLSGATDVVMVESLIVIDPQLATFSYEGVPDIRVIVFRGIPVMAMMRLACHASHGKANLHQGAIGVGLHMASGRAVSALQNDRHIRYHPDTQTDLLQLQLDNWPGLLRLACACGDISGLGYLGVDLVLDANHGPTLLELNARPGLSIQMANNAGLLPRLRRVEALSLPQRMSVAERLDFAANGFSV